MHYYYGSDFNRMIRESSTLNGVVIRSKMCTHFDELTNCIIGIKKKKKIQEDCRILV